MTSTEYRLRSQDEIVARITAYGEHGVGDFFGFRREVLVDALDYEHAKPYLKDGVTAEEWNAYRLSDLAEAAKKYLELAIGKIRNHRGISAERSVDKLTEYAWLLCRDDVLAAMDRADYPQYGAPKVKAFADGMGFQWPDYDDLARMARGEPCGDDCFEGCSS